MSRHGYSDFDDFDGDSNWNMIRWRGAVTSAIRGKRGQAFLRDLIEALDAMDTKELAHTTLYGEGSVCALGVVARRRGADLSEAQAELDDPDGDHQWATETAGDKLSIAAALAREVVWENDEGYWGETPEQRWRRVRAWAVKHLRKEST